MKLLHRLIIAVGLICTTWHIGGAKEPLRVACIGNSITYGYLLENPSTQSYPAQLQEMLGKEFLVGNFGHSGATLLRHGHRPYFNLPEFRQALDFAPEVAVIHLGVNDTDPRNWPHFANEFIGDYIALTDSLRKVNPDVRIIIANLTPIGAQHYRFRSGTRQWRYEIRDAIKRVAKITDAELIDFDRPLRNRQDLMPDGIHPDKEGAGLLAKTVYQAITGNYGGLQMPEIYQSGCVLQRDRYLPIYGTADAGSIITLTLNNRSYKAITDNCGHWKVTTEPLHTGGPYEMTVTDGKTSLHFTNILAGEVWIASGQSNMEFPLRDATNSAKDISDSQDELLRIFDMKAIARTDDVLWPDSTIAAINQLKHYKKAQWQSVSPKNIGDFSAVAYYFARQLRDSLQVPVGIICNAVGGSTCESWIDITTLENEMPEALINWRRNDYIQPWAQGRANKNTGTGNPRARHPYEPSYLFSAAIEPLQHFSVKGLIWYQGESNAHNTYIHESLFPMLADSWRRFFNSDDMPIIYAQLSSINRPSWPMFRDSQRLLQKRIKNAYMAVTHDVGDSLDVHPRMKLPVGERMARQALHNIYGFTRIQPHGPEPVKAVRQGNSIIISFSCADTLKSSDSMPIRTFEIADIDGNYHPASASIINRNEIKITNMDIKSPRFVRYGWQPFTRANLVNGDNLPASTFCLEAVCAEEEMESGIECGVSGAFAALAADGRIILAGGCNFPVEPMAPTSQKKFYRGIYAANPENMQWKRIGSLDAPSGYGATVVTPVGIVLIGGTPNGVASDDVKLLSIEGDVATISALPSLPVTLDNLAATAIGSKVYAVGGNADGAPSKSLFVLDMDNLSLGWVKLREMPGNPRVQPVMAAAVNPDGENVLYVWGGFAGRHGKVEPTLELEGLCYNPKKDKWSKIEGPKDSEGEELSVGGGAACTLSDGRIAVIGGVNKDIFLSALQNQAPDYLQHPVEWYRFNPNILVFDPKTEKWSVEVTTSDAARAGASIVAGRNADIFILGGEIKPRIRTAQSLHFKL